MSNFSQFYPPIGMVLISSIQPASGSGEVIFTNLPASKQIVVFCARADTAVSTQITIDVSSNNGSTWESGVALTQSSSFSTVIGIITGANLSGALTKVFQAPERNVVGGISLSGPINAIRLKPSAGTFTGTGGAFFTYGVN